MINIFQISRFKFPYDYKFPGQGSDEKILYLTRENALMLLVKQAFILIAVLAMLLAGIFIKGIAQEIMSHTFGALFEIILIICLFLFAAIGWWWVTTVWKKSIALVTTKRLIKFVYTTPVSRHSLALPLEMIVDTGAYTKGFIQTFLGLGTFVARSSATSSGVATDDPNRINKKYFFIENVKRSEDLQHYVSKLLSIFRKKSDELQNFRPFLPNLKGEARANFIAKNFPQFWS
jgi:hypothetical protein